MNYVPNYCMRSFLDSDKSFISVSFKMMKITEWYIQSPSQGNSLSGLESSENVLNVLTRSTITFFKNKKHLI